MGILLKCISEAAEHLRISTSDHGMHVAFLCNSCNFQYLILIGQLSLSALQLSFALRCTMNSIHEIFKQIHERGLLIPGFVLSRGLGFASCVDSLLAIKDRH